MSSAAPRGAPRRAQATGLLLCGGASRRMGVDKGALEFAGAPLVARALERLEALCETVLLASGRAPRYPELGRRCVLDPVPGAGPLAGLAAGLAEARTPYVLTLPCDMPQVEPAQLEELLERALAEDLDVCLPTCDGRPEPLCAVYRAALLPAVLAALAAGERRMIGFHKGYARRPLRVGGPSWTSTQALNLNTPEDYAAARGAARPRA